MSRMTVLEALVIERMREERETPLQKALYEQAQSVLLDAANLVAERYRPALDSHSVAWLPDSALTRDPP